jgi:hypothetical protein
MPGAPPSILITSAGGTSINTLPSSNPAGTPDTVALPVQGVINGVPMPIGPLPGGSAAIGSIIGRTSNPLATPTVTAAAYTAGQEIGGLMTFAVGGNGSGLLECIRVTSKSINAASLKFYVFDINPTNSSWVDKTTPAINALDVASLLAPPFPLSTWDSGLGTHTVWGLQALGCSFVGASLYGILVAGGGLTLASTSDITVKLGIVDD